MFPYQFEAVQGKRAWGAKSRRETELPLTSPHITTLTVFRLGISSVTALTLFTGLDIGLESGTSSSGYYVTAFHYMLVEMSKVSF